MFFVYTRSGRRPLRQKVTTIQVAALPCTLFPFRLRRFSFGFTKETFVGSRQRGRSISGGGGEALAVSGVMVFEDGEGEAEKAALMELLQANSTCGKWTSQSSCFSLTTIASI